MSGRPGRALGWVTTVAFGSLLAAPLTVAAAGPAAADAPTPAPCSAEAVASADGPEWSTSGYPGTSTLPGDTTTQQSLDAALASAKAIASSNGSRFPATAATRTLLEADDPTLTFLPDELAGSEGPTTLSVDTSTNGEGVILTALSPSGWCWAVLDNQAEQVDASLSGPPSEPWPSCATDPGTWYASFYLAPPAVTPEAPVTVALPILGAGVIGAVVYRRRRTDPARSDGTSGG